MKDPYNKEAVEDAIEEADKWRSIVAGIWSIPLLYLICYISPITLGYGFAIPNFS